MKSQFLKRKYLILFFFLLSLLPLNFVLLNVLWADCLKIIVVLFLSVFFAHLIFFIKVAYLQKFNFGNSFGVLFLLCFSLWGQLDYLSVQLSLISFSAISIFATLVLISVPIFFYGRKYYVENYRPKVHNFFLNDLIWFCFFFLLFLVQASFHSQIYWGEKPMDLSFISSFLKANHLPLTDPWFAHQIPHYYVMGYYLLALFPKIVSLDASIAYHVCFSFLFGINLWVIKDIFHLFLGRAKISSKKIWIFSFLTLMMPNFKSFTSFILKVANGHIGHTFSEFWSLTRIYPNALFTEYPSWSYLFADLHPHVISFSFSALFIFFALFYFKKTKSIFENNNIHFFFIFLCSFSLGLVGVINIWDYLLLSALFVLMVVVSFFENRSKKMFWALLVYPLSLLLFFPQWYYQLGGAPLQFGLRLGERENILQILNQFAGLLFLFALYLIFKIFKNKKTNSKIAFGIFVPITLVLIISNYFYLMDPINTVFKFHTSCYYVSSIFLSILLLPFIFDRRNKYFSAFTVSTFLLFNASNVSSFLTLERTWYLPEDWRSKGIEGKKYLSIADPELYQLINYFNTFIHGRPTIAELYGESFQHEKNMVSTYTGSASFMGWAGHVRIRGGNQRTILIRRDMIDQIYKSPDALLCYNLAKQNHIDFIVTTRAERDNYGAKVDQKFKTFADIFPRVICFGDTCLFGVKGNYEKYLGRSL